MNLIIKSIVADSVDFTLRVPNSFFYRQFDYLIVKSCNKVSYKVKENS